MQIFTDILFAFAVGGIFCVIAQLLIDLTKLTPARILVLYVTVGVVLGAIGLYQPLLSFAGCGASVPLIGFGGLIAKGVREAIDEKGMIGILSGAILNIFKHRSKEGNHLKQFRLFKSNSTRTHIELFLLVQTSDSCTMGAFHIIRIYLKLWFGIHPRVVRQENIMIFLVCLCSLSILRHDDLSIEIYLGRAPCNTLEQLTRITVRNLVMHVHSNLHPLIRSAYICTINIRLCSFPDKLYIKFHITAHPRHDYYKQVCLLTSLNLHTSSQLSV